MIVKIAVVVMIAVISVMDALGIRKYSGQFYVQHGGYLLF